MHLYINLSSKCQVTGHLGSTPSVMQMHLYINLSFKCQGTGHLGSTPSVIHIMYLQMSPMCQGTGHLGSTPSVIHIMYLQMSPMCTGHLGSTCTFISLRLSFLFKGCGLWTLSCDFVPHNTETLKWLSSLPTLMRKSFWWWQCSDRYIISLSLTSISPSPHSPRP